MNKNMEIITNLFEGEEIRSLWDSEKQDYFFSVIDVVKVLTNSNVPKRYWTDLKRQLNSEGSQLYENIVQLKMKAQDGKMRLTDVLDTKGIFRLIESIPSPKAEPFKLWLANLGKERIDEIFDPEVAINRSINYYRRKGYDDSWIKERMKGILDRNKLTKAWSESGVNEDFEYAILTNTIYKQWSGMTASEYKDYKNIRKESLRDNMSDLEVLLTDIGEITNRELIKEHKPNGLSENIKISKEAGTIANNTKKDIEKRLGKKVINDNNKLNYEYLKESDRIYKNRGV